MLFSMITINEIPDYLEDRKAGKLNLVARFGRETGVWLFTVSLLSAYAAILIGIILGRIPALGLISLLTLPIALKTVFILKVHYRDRVKMAPANLGMICTHNFTAILLMFAYFLIGFKVDAPTESFLPLAALIVLYIPIALLLGKALRLKKRDKSSLMTQT
jgi:1,4-dihydroxy-2-naphthoate octaprenyltransferase